MKKHLCSKCKFEVTTWSEELRKTHSGCSVMLQEKHRTTDFSESIIEKAITAKILGFGWITNGRMAFNDQIITQGVTKCDFFELMSE